MTKLVLRGLIIFVILAVAAGSVVEYMGAEFGTIDYFSKRGVFFLIFVTIFPRLTLLLSSVVTGGLVWWLGFIFCPRLLVAILATVAYFQTNPVLVVISWMVALSGEIFEKWGLTNRVVYVRTRPSSPLKQESKGLDENTFEAEYKHK